MRKPLEYSKAIQDSFKKSIEHNLSTIDGKQNKLSISNITFDTMPEDDDYERHKQLIDNKKTEGVKVFADINLINKSTGKVIEAKKKAQIAFLPTLTNRHSFLINGKEYVSYNQQRLKDGIFTKLDRKNVATADFNLSKGSNFSIEYSPAKERFMTSFGNTNIPLFTFLKDVYKTPDIEIRKYLGEDIYNQEMKKYVNDGDKELKKLYKSIVYDAKSIPENKEEIARKIKDRLDATKMNPKVNEMTMNHPFDKVSDKAMLHASKEVMLIHQGKKDPTWKDNMAFQAIHSTEDFIKEKMDKTSNELKNSLKARLNSKNKINDLLIGHKIQKNINDFFTKSQIINFPMQVNPVEFMENAHKITRIGPGALESVEAAPLDSRDLHTSQQGFIDLVRTPDNMNVGLDNRIAIGAYKKGNELLTIAINKQGKTEHVSPADLYNKTIASLGEKANSDGTFRAYKNGDWLNVPKSKIDYFINPSTGFTVTTAMIPFLESNAGQRCAMGAKFHTQALSLKSREVPLVTTQVAKLIEDAYVPKAKVNGVISKIDKGKITITDENNNKVVHNIPHEFPLNYHSYLHVDPVVKVGDTVKQGQILGDHNFSKDGKMALGVNLDVAFLPMKGFNFEDGIVITKQGSEKLISNHIFQEELPITSKGIIVNQKKYTAYYPGKYNISQLQNLDDAVVKKGTELKTGDPIILALREKAQSPESAQNKSVSKMISPYSDISMIWEKDYPGTVIDVVRSNSFIKVIIKAESPITIGDKIANRYGNKGVVTNIIDNHLAPRKADGSIPDVIFSPAGLKSRENMGQIHEAALGKIIKQKGLKSEYFNNFSGAKNFDHVEKALIKHGVTKEDDYIDPETGRTIKNVFNGNQHIFKLAKQTETNFSARAGGEYDIDLKPVKGGVEGSKNLGALDFYGLLAHGNTRSLLREKATYQAEYNPQVWEKLLNGEPLPAPQTTFAFKKLLHMMAGMGINVKKEGNELKLLPFTDKDILNMSSGEIKQPKVVLLKKDPVTELPFRPEAGGLFDPAITGGLKGDRYGHIKLATPIVNAVFERPARVLLDMTQKDFNSIAEGNKVIDVDNKKLTGGIAIKELLKKIDVDKQISEHSDIVQNSKSDTKKAESARKLGFLNALKTNNFKPHEAYLLNYLPVIPPNVRPVYPKDTGELVVSDANKHYQELIKLNNSFNTPYIQLLDHTDEEYQKAHKALSDSVKRLQGLDGKTDQIKSNEREPAGFLKTIIGSNPKYGFFQSKIASRTQDIVGRATVSVDPTLGMDTVKIPEPMAWTMYSPFLIGKMARQGYRYDVSKKEIEEKTDFAKNMLINEMKERPIIINRAPTLHKFGLLAFNPELTTGKTIKMNPFVVKGFNMDFDGDAVSTHLPITQEAVKETFNMLPSNHLFGVLNKNVMHTPDQDTIMGLYNMTNSKQTKPVMKFNSVEEVKKAYQEGKIQVHDKIELLQN